MKSQKSKVKSQKSEIGFTLVEIMVVVVIIGILATILVTQISGRVDEAAKQLTKSLIRGRVAEALEEFKMREKRYPDSLEELVRKPSYAQDWPQGGYLQEDQIKDGWGRPLLYKSPSSDSSEPFDLYSYGADGKEGGTGVNEDIWNYDKNQQ